MEVYTRESQSLIPLPQLRDRIVVFVTLYVHADPHHMCTTIIDSTLVILTGVSDIHRKTEDVTFTVTSYWSPIRVCSFVYRAFSFISIFNIINNLYL